MPCSPTVVRACREGRPALRRRQAGLRVGFKRVLTCSQPEAQNPQPLCSAHNTHLTGNKPALQEHRLKHPPRARTLAAEPVEVPLRTPSVLRLASPPLGAHTGYLPHRIRFPFEESPPPSVGRPPHGSRGARTPGTAQSPSSPVSSVRPTHRARLVAQSSLNASWPWSSRRSPRFSPSSFLLRLAHNGH